MHPRLPRFSNDLQRLAFAQGLSHAIVRLLECRGLRLTGEHRGRILGCSDVGTLDVWVERAVFASSADELFTVLDSISPL